MVTCLAGSSFVVGRLTALQIARIESNLIERLLNHRCIGNSDGAVFLFELRQRDLDPTRRYAYVQGV